MFEKFSDRARKVVQQARFEADDFSTKTSVELKTIGTTHLLLALAKSDGVATLVLRNFDVDYCKIRSEILNVTGREYEKNPSKEKLPYGLMTQNVFKFAVDESLRFGHTYVGTEHLLLGLMRESEGVAHTVLKNLGLTFPLIVKEIGDILGDTLQEENTPKLENILDKLKPLLVQQKNLIQQLLNIIEGA